MRSPRLTQRRVLVLVAVACVFSSFLPEPASRFLWSRPRQVKDMLITPLTHPLHLLSIGVRGGDHALSIPIDQSASAEEIAWYRTQVQRLKAELRDADDRLRRYEALAGLSQRGWLALDDVRFVSAHVTAWGGTADRPTLTINKGRTHGVERGMVVCDEVNLVGRVVDAGPMTATVELLTVPDEPVSVRIVPTTKPGEPAADGLPLVLRYEDDRQAFTQVTEIHANVNVGDLAHLDGAASWPREAWGLVVGQVVLIDRDEDPLNFKRLVVKPLMEPAYLRRVVVLSSPRE